MDRGAQYFDSDPNLNEYGRATAKYFYELGTEFDWSDFDKSTSSSDEQKSAARFASQSIKFFENPAQVDVRFKGARLDVPLVQNNRVIFESVVSSISITWLTTFTLGVVQGIPSVQKKSLQLGRDEALQAEILRRFVRFCNERHQSKLTSVISNFARAYAKEFAKP